MGMSCPSKPPIIGFLTALNRPPARQLTSAPFWQTTGAHIRGACLCAEPKACKTRENLGPEFKIVLSIDMWYYICIYIYIVILWYIMWYASDVYIIGDIGKGCAIWTLVTWSTRVHQHHCFRPWYLSSLWAQWDNTQRFWNASFDHSHPRFSFHMFSPLYNWWSANIFHVPTAVLKASRPKWHKGAMVVNASNRFVR